VTKEKLRRLIALSNRTALYRADGEAEELQALQAEFEAWEPEAAPRRPDPNVKPIKLERIGKDY
jgi:hypothetical protein